MKRRVFSVFLCVALCVGLLPVTARAVAAGDFASLKSETEGANVAVTVPAGTYDGNGKTITLPSGVSLTVASGTTVTLKNMTIKAGSNYSTAYTKIANYGTLTMENVNVVGDENTSYGGRGLANFGTAILKNCDFYQNNATDGTGLTGASFGTRGGGIYTQGPTLILDSCSFRNNTNAGNYGGAVAVLGTNHMLYANNTVFSGNTSGSNNGAAVYHGDHGEIYMLNCTITNNGTAAAFYNPPTGIKNCIVLSSSAYSYADCVNGTNANATTYLNSATPTQKGDYGYYFPVKDDNNNAAKKGTLDTWFSYDADGGNVKMGYRTASTADNYSSLISGTFTEPTDGTVNRANTYFEGGTRESNIVGASGLPYPTVTFDSNGGSAVESQQITSSSVFVSEPAAPTRSGYTFDGWYSDAGLTTAYNFGSTIDASITLYAKWTITTPITVAFDANGGSGTMDEQQVPSGVATPLNPMSGLTGPEGKPTFTGWNTLQNPTTENPGTAYANGAEITISERTTLYAQWSALQDTEYYEVTDATNLTVTLKSATVANLQAALASAAKTIIVPSSISDIPTNTELTGSGKTVILSKGATLTTASSAAVSIHDLTIQAASDYATNATKLTNYGTLTMENVVVTGAGRGLSNPSGKVAILKNCDICNNTCTLTGTSGYGAGINNAGTLVLDGCSVSRNQNNSNGGGISSQTGKLYANNTVFAGNHATGTGGAIAYGTIYLLNCSFVNNVRNSSSENAAAVWVAPKWYVVNCVFANNIHINTSTNAETQEVANLAPETGMSNLYTAMPTNMTTDTVGATAIYGKDTPDVIASEGRPYGYYAPILDNDTTRGGVKTYFYYNDTASVIYMGYGSGNTQLVAEGTPSDDQKATAVTAYMESSSGRAADMSGNYIIGASAPVLSVTYNVTLNTNGGTINSGNVTSYTYGVGATLPTNVTKSGCTFGGWYEDSGFSGSAVTTIGTTDTRAKTYYAKWTQLPATAGTVTANEFTYSGSAQELVTATAATYGTMQYKVGDGEYSVAIPTATDAGTYTVTYKAVGTDGYGDSAEQSVPVTISPKTVSSPTIELSPASYTYDGSAKEPGVTVKDSGTVIPASEYTVSYSNNINAGTNTATVTIADNAGGNYTVSGNANFTIDKAAYTGTKTVSTTVRSGQETDGAALELPALPAGAAYGAVTTSGGLISGTPSVSGTTLTYSTTSQTEETSATITIRVTGATNYNDYDVVVTVTAKAKDPAGVSITDGDKVVTYGDAGFTLARTVTSAGEGTGVWTWSSGTPTVATIDSSTGTVSIVGQGTTAITAKYESDTTIGEATVTLTVSKAALAVTANDNTIIYGEAPAGAGVTYSGWKYSDTESVLTGTPSYSYDYSQYGNVGNNYAITPAGLSAANYNISYVPGTLTVQQKEVGLGWSNTTLTYSGSEQAPTATATGLVNGDTISVTVTGGQTDAGAYTATASGLTGDKAGNYKLPSAVTQSFTIGKATQSTPPTISSVTSEGVATLSAALAEGGAVQYVISTDAISDFGSVQWRDATLDAEQKFAVSGTSPGRTYNLYVRYAESANYNASATSASATFTTPATCAVTFESTAAAG